MIENPTEEQLKSLKMIIYCITNTITGKKYIGKAIRTFSLRYTRCEWWKNPSNNYIKNSVIKYGLENFKVSILEYGIKNREILAKLEISYIEKLNTIYPNGYNYTKGGEQNYHTEETKKLLIQRSSKNYILYDHFLEKEIHIFNLAKFARENNLIRECLRDVYNGSQIQYLQYTKPGVKINKWFLVSPKGISYKIINGFLFDFCQKFNLPSLGNIHLLVNNKIKYCLGWTNLNPVPIEKVFIFNGEAFYLKYGDFNKHCKKFKLNKNKMAMVWNGELEPYKDWTKGFISLDYQI